jgi:hypothetical protein
MANAPNAKADIGGPFVSVADLISFKLAQLRQAALGPTAVRQVYAKRPFNAAVSISLPYMGQTMRKGEFRRCSSLKGESGCHQLAITRDR